MVEFMIHGSTGEQDCPDVEVTVAETEAGLQFTLEVVSGGQTGDPIADLLAFYINFPDSQRM